MKQDLETVKKTVKFNPENFHAVLKALREVKGALQSCDFDRTAGTLHLVVTKGTALSAFEEFHERKGEKMDQRLKVAVVPLVKNLPSRAINDIHDALLSDFASTLRRVTFKKGERLTVLFLSAKGKDEFVALLKASHLGDITFHLG